MSEQPRFETLLSPVAAGPLQFRNRLVSTSHQTSLVHDYLPTDDLLAYHEARARGGVGAIFLEATAVHPTGLLTAHTMGGYLPEIVPAYRRIADAVQTHGARLLVQLFHGGRELIASAPRPPAVAPSAVPSLRFKSEPRALTLTEIRELIAGYALSARHAREGGLDGVEISIAHGYLPAQFLSALSNRRGDRYDGSPDGRLRFVRELLSAVREAAGPELAVGARLAADELVAGGLGVQECIAVAGALHRDGLVDFASLALGHSAYPAASTWIAPPPPTPRNAIAPPATAIRAALPGLALIATTRVVELADAERIIADGGADLVGMTRALIADPELLAKAVAGRDREVIACVGCNQACIGHYHAGVPIGCAVNPRTGREAHLKNPAPGRRGRRVLVIGAGPAGAAAALEAATRGRRRDVGRARARDRGPAAARGSGACSHRVVGALSRIDARSPASGRRGGRARRRGRRRAGGRIRRRRAGDRCATVSAELARRAGIRGLPGVGRDRRPGPDSSSRPRGGLGRRLGRARRRRTPRARGSPGDARVRSAGARRDAAPVPAQPISPAPRRARGADPAPHGAVARRRSRRPRAPVLAATPTPAPDRDARARPGPGPGGRVVGALEAHPGAVRAGDVLGPRTMEEAVLEGTQAVQC